MDAAAVYSNIDIPAVSFVVAAAIALITLPLASLMGYMAGKARRKKVPEADLASDLAQDETTISAILALLGLLLAFSFGNALSHSQDIKTSITDEASALGTAFLRVDLLDTEQSRDLQEALYAYAETRLLPGDGRINTVSKAQDFLTLTLEAQAKLWPLTLAATQDPTPPAIKALVVSAVNDALDAHLYRVQTMTNPISDITRFMMLAASFVALFLLGNRSGLMGRKLTWRIHVFSGFLFLVMTTIMDTQRGGEGFVRVDDTTLRATVLDMKVALGGDL